MKLPESGITQLPKCCGGKQGGRVLVPSCNVRYELYPFYHPSNASAPSPSPSPSPSGLLPTTNSSNSGGSSGISSGTIVTIVVPISVAVMLFILGLCFLSPRRAGKKNDSAVSAQDQHTATEITGAESLRYDLTTIEAATNNFSEANKFGEGGFGKVYESLLSSGQEVAVKRLSKSSG